jgi:tetratricopeptide (TPR) repeat protein
MPSLRRSIDQLLSSAGARSQSPKQARFDQSGVIPSLSGKSLHGQVPPRFRILARLGDGGMGVVYRAYDSELAADVALKTLSGLSPNDLYHLKQEFRALADIRHPNLIDFYELFADEHVCFFTMELIAGLQLPAYLRARTASGEIDEGVFRDMARQLALAVTAVHARMKLHRDIKPSNVMVTNAGRLVLLDFGLAIGLSSDGTKTERGGFAGTMGYMAPEQVRGDEMTTAVDWYGVGATLFESASGRLPFDHPLKGLSREQQAPHVRHFVPTFPEDIDQLIADLLHSDAGRRPTGIEVLQRLGVESDGVAPSTPAPHSTPSTTFEGRQGELETLGAALEDVRRGTTSVVHVHGPSGIGKSELARRFVERAVHAGAGVLRGRCHPQETVAFNALDGAIDDLSRLLSLRTWADVPMPDAQQAEALIRIFPVLGRVESIAERAWGAGEGGGAEAFRQATRALKELLAEAGRRQPLVIWIDDAQWGDEGSGTLLRELLAEPNAPTLLLLLTYRSEDREVSPALRALADIEGLASIDVPLAPLSEDETLALIERLLLGRGADSAEHRAHLARETHGLPFFIQELARYLAAPADDDRSVPSHVRLGDLIRARVERLDEAARRVLEVVSVAGGPLEQRVLVTVAGPGAKPRRTLAMLERECLVRTLAIEADRRSEVYHHRIRDEVLDGLTDARRRSYHRAIADAMLTTDLPRLARVVEHYDAAGDEAAVRRYVVVAANDAAGALAFDLAARLYRRAIAVGGTELDDVELHARLGEALANAGRSRPAGEAFSSAASTAERNAGSGYRSAYLRRLAAAQFLKGGHRDEAEAALRTVLSPLRLELPRSRREAMRKTLVSRVRLLVRGLDFDRRARGEVPAQTLDRLDILHVLAVTVAWVDHTKAAWLGTRFLLEALDAGDASRVARALSTEVALWAPLAGAISQRQVDRMLTLLAELGSDSGVELSAADRAGYYLCRGIVASCRGRFAAACADLTRARDMASAVPYGIAFELSNCEIFRLPVLAVLGRLRELRVDLEAALRTADDRGDDFLVSMCGAGEPSLAWLASDQPDEAARWADRALRLTAPGYSSDSYSTQHYLHLFTSVSVELYRERGLEACERMETAWPQLEANYFLTLRWVREQLLFLRARAAIAAALAIRHGERSPRAAIGAEKWLSLALEQATKIERHRLPFAPPMTDLVRAGVAGVRRQRAKARAHLERAAAGFGAQEMHLYEHIARYCLENPAATPPSSSPSSGSPEGSTSSSPAGPLEGQAWLLAQGVRRPEALAHLLSPGCLPED